MRCATLVSSYAEIEVAMDVVSVSRMNWLTSDGNTARSAGFRMMRRKTSAGRRPRASPASVWPLGMLSTPPRMISIA